MNAPSCFYGCGRTKDLRPYGPGGASVCFECATATPERNEAAQANFVALLNAAEAMSPYSATVLNVDGIHPMTNPPGAVTEEDTP